jgi:hypothetical protein
MLEFQRSDQRRDPTRLAARRFDRGLATYTDYFVTTLSPE